MFFRNNVETMKKNIVTIVLSLALAVVGYLLGSSNAMLRDHEMCEARGRLGINLRRTCRDFCV